MRSRLTNRAFRDMRTASRSPATKSCMFPIVPTTSSTCTSRTAPTSKRSPSQGRPIPSRSLPIRSRYYLYAGGMNSTATMYILRRSDLQLLGSFKSAGQHFFNTDSKGNLFTCGLFMPEKFVLKDLPTRTSGAR